MHVCLLLGVDWTSRRGFCFFRGVAWQAQTELAVCLSLLITSLVVNISCLPSSLVLVAVNSASASVHMPDWPRHGSLAAGSGLEWRAWGAASSLFSSCVSILHSGSGYFYFV